MIEQLPVNQILKKAAEKSGFNRTKYIEKNVPTNVENVSVFIFFGDMRSTAILSSLLLRKFKEEAKGSKYFIVCSWPGQEGLFPWVDEYWSIKDEGACRSLYNKSNGFHNKSDLFIGFQRVLNSFFVEVLDFTSLEPFYENGFKKEFFDRFKNIKRYFPSVPSSVILGNEFNRKLSSFNRKVFIEPTMYIQGWTEYGLQSMFISKDFWVEFIGRLLKEGIMPVIWHNFNTYDVSGDFVEKCVYLAESDALNVLSAMRSTGCVLDIFSGLSKYSILARCPYLACCDRVTYNCLKDYEFDDLCGFELPKYNLWSFPSICEENNRSHWNSSLFDVIILKLTSLLNNLEKEVLPSPTEQYDVVAYSRVREIKSKKLATHFIKIPKY